jgi:hypothetical protein
MQVDLSPGRTNSETNASSRPLTLRPQRYVRFTRFGLCPQGIRCYFRRSPLLRSGLRVLGAGYGTGVATLALRETLSACGLPLGLTTYNVESSGCVFG